MNTLQEVKYYIQTDYTIQLLIKFTNTRYKQNITSRFKTPIFPCFRDK